MEVLDNEYIKKYGIINSEIIVNGMEAPVYVITFKNGDKISEKMIRQTSLYQIGGSFYNLDIAVKKYIIEKRCKKINKIIKNIVNG